MKEPIYSDELKDEWKRIDRALIPMRLHIEMPQPECKGLTLLTDVMINATVCKLGPRVGQITAPYSDDIEIVLDVAETIRNRMRSPWRPGQPIDDRLLAFGRNLATSVQCSNTGAKANVCIVAKGEVVPAIDDCVSFVLWAETGFFEPPWTLNDRIQYVRNPELYERKRREESLARREKMRIEKERRDLVIKQRRTRYQAQTELELERQRISNLGWRELITEHESASPPIDTISRSLYELRISLLNARARASTIGQH